jgi:serine O-acetyltransferase
MIIMITSKKEYLFYLESDRIALNIKKKKPSIIGDEIWKFEQLLRKLEYYINCNKCHFPFNFYLLYLRFKFHYYSLLLGFSIGINTFGPGLSIAHIGTIIVHGNSRIGENCRIHACVNIGTQAGYADKVPKIGNNVFIGPGVNIFGDISIADDIAIGANSCVNKTFTEPCITIAGIPAKKISDKGSFGLLFKATNIMADTINPSIR